MESALSAFAAFFLAHSTYFNNFRQKNAYFDISRQKRVLFNCFATKQCLGMYAKKVLYGSLWLPLWLSLALTATLWHTLALSGSLLLSNFAYTALDRLTGLLLGSHCRCHDDALSPALVYISQMVVLKTTRLLFLDGLKCIGNSMAQDDCDGILQYQ